jgi:hypothetical protein
MKDINTETDKKIGCSIVRDVRFRLSLQRLVFIPRLILVTFVVKEAVSGKNF